jgi:DNA-binding MarR family transcriptional regulator
MRKAERVEVSRATRGREATGGVEATFTRSRRRHRAATAAAPAFSRETVWYRLMKLTNLINRPFFARFAQRYHLTINDARVLMTLASLPEAAAHELCEASGMHPMNVSRSVATLRRQGRIGERRDPDNRRRKILRLTARGWAVSRMFLPDMNTMSDFLLASMSTYEIEFLSKLVDQLIARLQTADAHTGLPEAAPRARRRASHA